MGFIVGVTLVRREHPQDPGRAVRRAVALAPPRWPGSSLRRRRRARLRRLAGLDDLGARHARRSPRSWRPSRSIRRRAHRPRAALRRAAWPTASVRRHAARCAPSPRTTPSWASCASPPTRRAAQVQDVRTERRATSVESLGLHRAGPGPTPLAAAVRPPRVRERPASTARVASVGRSGSPAGPSDRPSTTRRAAVERRDASRARSRCLATPHLPRSHHDPVRRAGHHLADPGRLRQAAGRARGPQGPRPPRRSSPGSARPATRAT